MHVDVLKERGFSRPNLYFLGAERKSLSLIILLLD